jgi:hypothetical protein
VKRREGKGRKGEGRGEERRGGRGEEGREGPHRACSPNSSRAQHTESFTASSIESKA